MLVISIYVDLPRRRSTRCQKPSLVNGNSSSLFLWDQFIVWLHTWLCDTRLLQIISNWLDYSLPRQTQTSGWEIPEIPMITPMSTWTNLFFQKWYHWHIERIEHPLPTEGGYISRVISGWLMCVCVYYVHQYVCCVRIMRGWCSNLGKVPLRTYDP